MNWQERTASCTDVLARVPTGRLVVLGEPGAGKTVMMVRLVLTLLARRASGDPVPILTSVASWNPSQQDLEGWLGAQLLIDHPALASQPADRKEPTLVAALIADGLILPILDGLDEIPGQMRSGAISRINDALQPGRHAVVTCRAQQYRDAVRPPDGLEATLRAAPAVQLHSLSADDVRRYLCDDAAGPAARARWTPVLNALGTDAPVAQALKTPLMVGLARAIYNPRPGELVGTLPDPAELEPRHGRPAKRWSHCCSTFFIPAAYRHGANRRWKAPDAEEWLSFLARQLEYTLQDLAWWQLPLAVPRFRVFRAAVAVVCGPCSEPVRHRLWAYFADLIGGFFDLKAGALFGYGALIGAVVGGLYLGYSGVEASEALSPEPTGISWRPPARQTFVTGLVCGIIAGVVVGVGILPKTFAFIASPPWLVSKVGSVVGSGINSGVVAGALVAVIAGFIEWVSRQQIAQPDVNAAASPSTMLARDRSTGSVVGVLLGTGAGVLAWITVGLWGGMEAGIGAGAGTAALVGIVASSAAALSPSYEAARVWLAFHGLLPWPFMGFLADAHRRGVLRQPGAVYQFRHVELQHRLARTSAKIGAYYDVQDVNGNRYRVTLVKVIDPAPGAGQDTVPDNGNRLVGAVFTIEAPDGSPQGEDANWDAAVIGNDGQIYSADANDIAGYTKIDSGPIHVAQGEVVTGVVTFQVPDGIDVPSIRWTADGGLGFDVQWRMHR